MRNNYDHSLNVIQGSIRPGPMVLVGLGPGPQVMRGWHHGSYCWVRAQSPIGPRGSGTIQVPSKLLHKHQITFSQI